MGLYFNILSCFIVLSSSQTIYGLTKLSNSLKTIKVQEYEGDVYLNCSTSGDRNVKSLKWVWYPFNHPNSPVIVGEVSESGKELQKETIEVEKWYATKTSSEFNIRVLNVTWAHRGDYQCLAGDDVIEHIKLNITTVPYALDCFLTDTKLSPHYWYFSNIVQIVTCNVTCTHPEPKTIITGEHIRIKEESSDCSGDYLGMKSYSYLYVVKNSTHTFSAIGLGYHKNFRFHFNGHTLKDDNRNFENLYLILFITFLIVSILLASVLLYSHTKHRRQKKWGQEKGQNRIVKIAYNTLENDQAEIENNDRMPDTFNRRDDWDAGL